MQFWTKLIAVSFIVVSCSISADVKPLFVIDLSLHNNKEFKLSITSKSDSKEKYKIIINAPASDIKILSDKTEFLGELGSMDSEQFILDFEPMQEGHGIISVSVYTE